MIGHKANASWMRSSTSKGIMEPLIGSLIKFIYKSGRKRLDGRDSLLRCLRVLRGANLIRGGGVDPPGAYFSQGTGHRISRETLLYWIRDLSGIPTYLRCHVNLHVTLHVNLHVNLLLALRVTLRESSTYI